MHLSVFTPCSSKIPCFLGKAWDYLLMRYKVINAAWYLLWQLLCILFNHLHHGSQLFFPFISFFAYASEREWCNTQVDKSFSPSCISPLYLHFRSFTIWLFFLLLNNRTFMFQMQMPLEYSISNLFRLPWEKISLQHTSIQQVIWLCIKRAPLVLEKTFKNHIMSISCLPLLYLDAFPLKLLIMLRGATFAT